MAKKKDVVPVFVDNVEALEAKMQAMRDAQKIFATYTQEQVDKIFYAAAVAANKMRIPLAKQAVEETGRGIVEDKVIKNHYAAEYIYNAYKDTKTCGVIEEDKAFGIKKIAEPIGLVAAVIPTTNPTSTAIFKTLICLKTRNAIIISPHPAAKASTIAAAKVVLDAAVKAGAPEGIIGWIDAPSLTLGCGSWGGNSVSENVGVKHLLNIKTVAERRENMLWFRTPDKVYFKKGCMPVALDELGNVLHKKKAFIVTDSFLYKNGYVAPIEQKLDELGIQHTCFFEVAPDPTLQCAEKGVDQMRAFEPDTIIALGGGSAMDAAKIMWVMYEHPEADFEDMAMDFMDIRKRVFTFPKMGEKAYFVAIPTSSGTGSEVTPFAIITDAETGVKWPIADYELLPNMAIVDVDNMMTQPKGLTSASGIDVMTHAIEAYVSIMATDYTDGLALKAAKAVFEYLPRAYDNGANDPEAREKMANASCMAGMAFANAFLGLNHSMAHKLGAFHHLPHGVANAVILTEVMRYNAAEVPTKMGTFSQYQYPHALARYAEIGRFVGCQGKDDAEVFENFIAKLEELKEKIGIKKSIHEYGIDEKYFMDTLDDMVEQAFNDQCTAANPRYPLMKEIKELYLKCW